MATTEGQWKLHWWFAAQEVNKVVIYEGNNTQIWLRCGEHLGSDLAVHQFNKKILQMKASCKQTLKIMR